MAIRAKIILNRILLFIVIFFVNKSSAQRYFACDSTVVVTPDSIVITSHCAIKLNLSYFPEKYFDTLHRSDSRGRSEVVSGLIEYKGNTKNKKGVYRVYINGKTLEECEMLNYIPHGYYKQYVRGYNAPPKICVEKIQFKNGLKHGKSIKYSQKTRRKLITEKYYEGQLIKKIEKYEKWE